MARTDTQVAIRVRPELHKQLKENAVKEERSMNYLINKAIEQFLEKQSAKA
ncbi:toxin-antitoxin system HicB family antitoxin [Acinetobacter ursingii]|uniref:toxin-antitoxin system HicB family antitoxin n=1 Tax=Acinetobacter ursingii TaxID=108980 RepID=UPI00125064B9|nr:toxin-antitoxin system HicB family antitoxin [Acinetobacter ursingii]MCU4483567.1 type II toxin-antitoxin system HicB family antitoxin [Acinetobacter ursingii]MCU4507887.1 type II toxin-antitoxin system HicB family antitoxin [Acinetobacter ursingii]MDU4393282.1 toxin-antitoxin system HicB family antitoxin [Acinetobacter ursingii]